MGPHLLLFMLVLLVRPLAARSPSVCVLAWSKDQVCQLVDISKRVIDFSSGWFVSALCFSEIGVLRPVSRQPLAIDNLYAAVSDVDQAIFFEKLQGLAEGKA